MKRTLKQAREAGTVGGERAQGKAERVTPGFSERARQAMLDHLTVVREAAGEDLTDIAKAKGARPPDDRAFGPILCKLQRLGLIRRLRDAPRKKGNGTRGGSVYGIVEQSPSASLGN